MGVLKDKVAIVTGAGRGIGKEISLYFAKEGAKVVVNDLGGERDGSGGGKIADKVVNEINSLGGESIANYDTVGTVEGGQNIFSTALDNYNQVDILVNNAGILRDKTLYNMEESDWDLIMEVHLKGHYNCTKPLVRYIRDTNRVNCRIINMSSVSGLYGNFGQTNYGAAKSRDCRIFKISCSRSSKISMHSKYYFSWSCYPTYHRPYASSWTRT